MNILCTGNPTHKTVASAVKKLWPDAKFASRTNGYDFKSWTDDTQTTFKENIINFDVFINSSFIYPGVQMTLLDTVCATWMEKNVKGHIINIGTTLEWEGHSQYRDYVISKQQFRARSLELNQQTGITGVKTSYIIVGGINDGRDENSDKLDLHSIAECINWILHKKERIGLLQIEVDK